MFLSNARWLIPIVGQVLLARSAFQNADGESREWLIEKMYATSRKFYYEYAHVLVQVGALLWWLLYRS